MIVLLGTYMWTNFVLLISKIFQSSGFSGAIYIWVFGLPLFNFIIIFTSDDKLDVLSTKVNEFKKGEEVQKYIRYFLEMVGKRGKERSVDIHLKGFVYNHEENCTISDCPLKKFKKLYDKSNIPKEGHNHEDQATASHTANNGAQSHGQHQSSQGANGGGHAHGHSKIYLKQRKKQS